MKHSPNIRLEAARMELDVAHHECPHWDFENDTGDVPHECCYRLDEAKREYRLARKAAKQ